MQSKCSRLSRVGGLCLNGVGAGTCDVECDSCSSIASALL